MGYPMIKLRTKSVLLAAALCLGAGIASAQVCSEWLWSNTMPQGNRLNGAAYGGGVFVAVGSAGAVLTSRDGSSWTPRFPNTRSDLFDGAWGGQLFVAIGAGGAAFTSPDGVFWARRPVGTAATLRRVAWE